MAIPHVPLQAPWFKPTTYPPNVVASAIAATQSTSNYPHQFDNREGIKLICSGAKVNYEHPLRAGADKFLGPHRVVYQYGTSNFCGCITHVGVPGNNFTACKWNPPSLDASTLSVGNTFDSHVEDSLYEEFDDEV